MKPLLPTQRLLTTNEAATRVTLGVPARATLDRSRRRFAVTFTAPSGTTLAKTAGMNGISGIRGWALLAMGCAAFACGSTNRSSSNDHQEPTSGTGDGAGLPGVAGLTAGDDPAGMGGAGAKAGGGGQGDIAGVGGVYYGDGAANIGGGGYYGIAGISGTGGIYLPGVGGVYFGDGGPNLPSVPCTSPALDQQTGLVTCAEGYTHRAKVVACQLQNSVGEGGAPGLDPRDLPRADGTVLCDETPSKCAQYQFGYCDVGHTGACRSGCETDEDCGPGYACHCPATPSKSGGVCEPTQCRSDADCQQGALCATFDGLCGRNGFACQSVSDTCASSTQCGGQICTWDPTTYSRHCAFANCAP